MDSSILWPANHMLRFPSVFNAGDFCGTSGLLIVSLFKILQIPVLSQCHILWFSTFSP